jgi:multidrug efflux pump subunit AcrB
MNPVRFSLRHPQVALVLTAMLLVVGVHALLKMPRREDPKIVIRTGLVIAEYPGATPEQVEKEVAKPIEERLFRFEEVRKDKTYSTSRSNLVMVSVELEDSVKDTDKFWAKLRNDMIELKYEQLPQGVIGPLVDSDFGDTVAILLAVRGDRYGYRELKDYSERIEDQLRTLRAVSKIKRIGEQKEQILLTSSLERLSQYGVTPLRIVQAFQQRNLVEFGGTFKADNTVVPLRPTGLFQTEDQVRKVMIDVSPTGRPVYVGDFADVERKYQDPEYLTRINGQKCLMLSVEMQEGYNIVDFGSAVDEKLKAVKSLLPPDLEMTLIAKQPKVVEHRIDSFMREFGIAIAAVILVTMILLPFRVATIAAIAIPVTVAITFAVLNALKVELHQVSIAALIVVLGMVVDDAIVVADNYVELLDRGVARDEAAWRCASELAVPILTATLTIVAAFLPLLLLTGSVGEFISALPIAVAVSLSSSYLVAMLLTPLMCRFFIHKGLRSEDSNQAVSRKKGFSFNPLERMQSLYDRAIKLAMAHKKLTAGFALLVFAGGLLLLPVVPSQFFPYAERNQFVIDVWMPEGTKVEATDAVLRRIEGELRQIPDVRDCATFLGSSAPRFYYNVDPQEPATNYGQVLVNTSSAEITPALVARLRKQFARTCPEAMVIVKELQQGTRVTAPIEVRVVGGELTELKQIGQQVIQILRDSPGTTYVHHDFYDDSYDLKIDVNPEVANRLGFTNASIARQLAGSFEGAPVSTFWEGDRAVDIVLRLDEDRRRSFDNIRDAYLTGLLTGTRVPLREMAHIAPEWQTSRIVRRNGVRTLTVGSYLTEGHLASEVLKKVRPKIAALSLPLGYRIDYGGEDETQRETFAQMSRALMVSLVGIFLILMFEFRSLKQSLLVMVSIALALLGAVLGLIVTNNPFGFTAYVGIVSLSGIVVRNAIILVDYINERRAQGEALEAAALEAGRRRLRPIFLTTMAAAVGVTPMILSGSSLWSPLASTIAVGLIFSMVNTLIVVPVLYILMERGTASSQAQEARS